MRMKCLEHLQSRVKHLKREVYALYLAMRHPMTPWYAKALAAVVVVYAVSPIDLIPDPVPVLGYLDDLILVPLGVLMVRRLIPKAVLEECRVTAKEPVQIATLWKVTGAVIVMGLWITCLIAMAVAGWRYFA